MVMPMMMMMPMMFWPLDGDGALIIINTTSKPWWWCQWWWWRRWCSDHQCAPGWTSISFRLRLLDFTMSCPPNAIPHTYYNNNNDNSNNKCCVHTSLTVSSPPTTPSLTHIHSVPHIPHTCFCEANNLQCPNWALHFPKTEFDQLCESKS